MNLDKIDRKHQIPAGIRVVKPGDTLYSVAREYYLQPEFLAKLNELAPPFIIYPGQQLVVGTQKKIQRQTGLIGPLENTLGSTVSAQVSKPLVPTSPKPIVPKTSIKWQWPVRGKILQGFSEHQSLSKGIDIGGRLNEPVSSTAPGTVVYRGNALKAYGNLVIIKHKEDFLSAYAHNSQVKVKEGDLVKAGQVIATMGSTGTEGVKLHFEIRYKGKPLDPMLFLPK